MTFHAVLELGELAEGSMTRVELTDRDVLLARVNGEIFAVDDLCTHEEASLSSGVLRGARVRCPLHGSWFCLRTGEPQEEPADEPVRCYATRVRDGRVEISLNDAGTKPNGTPL